VPGTDEPADARHLPAVRTVRHDHDQEALREAFDDLPELQRWDLASLVGVERHSYEVAANWKLLCENYNECYHCALAHPQLHRLSRLGDAPGSPQRGKNFVGGPMPLRDGFNTMSTTGITNRLPLPGSTDTDRRRVQYFNLLPNLFLSIAPDYVITHMLWPRDAGHCFVETEWLAAPSQLREAGFDLTDAVEFWELTNRRRVACIGCSSGARGTGRMRCSCGRGRRGSGRRRRSIQR